MWLGPSSATSKRAIDHLIALDNHAMYLQGRTRLQRLYQGVFWYLIYNLVRGLALTVVLSLGASRQWPYSTLLLARIWLLELDGWSQLYAKAVNCFAFVCMLRIVWEAYPLYRQLVRRSLSAIYTPTPPEVDALREFFDREWFRRIWVIQEVVAAKEAIILVDRERYLGQHSPLRSIVWIR